MMRNAHPVASLLKPFDEKSFIRAIREALGRGTAFYPSDIDVLKSCR
jgi:hypothetical protein